MAWQLTGTYFENCSCEMPCPCTVSFDAGADYDRCQEVLGSERMRIEYENDGLSHRVSAGDGIDVQVKDVVPFGVESGEPARLEGVFHPAGSTLTIAKSQRGKISAFGLEFDNTGRSAFSAPFSWAA